MISAFFAELGSLASGHVSLLMMLLKATIILIVALGVTLSMQRASAGARHLVWLVTLAMLLLVPALSTWAPLPLRILPAASSALAAPSAASPAGAPRAEPAPRPVVDGAAKATGMPTGSVAAPSSSSLTTAIRGMSGVAILLSIWAAVVLSIAITLAWAAFAVRRIVRRARPLESPDWVNPLFEIADRLGLEEAPRLLQSADAKMPFACGVMKATIVLPAESESWSLDRRRAVLLHELAHVRRHDLLGHTLGRFVCAVYWFHPLVWTAAKRLRSESERACDDLALACGTRATDYAEHLLDIVTSVRGDGTPLVALAMARRKEFEGRMLAILDPDLRHSTPTRRQSLVLMAMLALVSLTVGAASPVARRADAAQVAQTPQHRSSVQSPARRVAPRTAPVQGKAYPDSAMRGVTSMSTSYTKTESVAFSKHESTHESQIDSSAKSLAQATASSDVALNALAKASSEYAMSVVTSVVPQIMKLGRHATSKNPDDRPILLAKVLKMDSSATNRRVAAWGLQEYGNSQAGEEALTSAVRRDADARVREMAAWSLSNYEESTTARDALAAALKSDASERVRVTAAWALGNGGSRASEEVLSAALSDASADVRIRAAWALGNISPRQAPKPLVALLGDKDPRVRTLVAWALHNIQDPSTASAIETALKTEQDKEVQLAEIRALASLGEKSVDAIRGLLESPDARIKQMAVRALAGGRASGPWPWPWPEPRPFP